MRSPKELQPFSKNIQNFIYVNSMNRQQFADEINNRLSVCDDSGEIYTNNDIWTYECRGSYPKNKRALKAIADILGKPLEDLFVTVFTREELLLVPPQTSTIKYKNWQIELLNELNDLQREFLYALIAHGELEGKNSSPTVMSCFNMIKVKMSMPFFVAAMLKGKSCGIGKNMKNILRKCPKKMLLKCDWRMSSSNHCMQSVSCTIFIVKVIHLMICLRNTRKLTGTSLQRSSFKSGLKS